VAGNKLDLESARQVPKQDGATFANEIHSPFFETSAKDGTSVDEAFYELVRRIRKRKLDIKKNQMCRCIIS
jgi:GTPase SAR1 family protein